MTINKKKYSIKNTNKTNNMIAQWGFLTMADERRESYLQSELRPEQRTNQPTFRRNTVTKY